MEIVLVVILVGVFSFWRSQARSKRFVRAVDYLRKLDIGCSVTEANQIAGGLFGSESDPDIDNQAIRVAIAYSEAQFGGKQLPIISLARQRGFQG